MHPYGPSRDRRGFVLLGSIFLVLFLSILTTAMIVRSEYQLKETDMLMDSHHAFYAAEAGLEQTIAALRRRQPAPIPGVQYPLVANAETLGFYEVQVGGITKWNNLNSRWVLSRGWDPARKIQRCLLARVVVINQADFLFLSLGDLHAQPKSTINGDVFSQDIYFDGPPVKMNGYVYYLRNIIGESNVVYGLDPMTGASFSAYDIPAITFPGIDLVQNRNGSDLVLPGGQVLDLANLPLSPGGVAPSAIFVNGDVEVFGNYDHAMVITAAGTIYLNGDIQADPLAPGPPQLGLLAARDVIIPEGVKSGSESTMTIEALLLADGQDDGLGMVYAVGEKGRLIFTGAIAARGNPDKNIRTTIDLNTSFSTRSYSYNPQLATNLQIPLLNMIVNVSEWREVVPPDDVLPP